MRLLLIGLVALGQLAESPSVSAAEETPKKPPRPLQVGVLLFDGVELLDFAGPAEVFIVAEHGRWFDVHTVAASKEPVKTMGGVTVTPSHSYKDAPKLDILVVPGGAMTNVARDGRDWIKRSAKDAQVVMSVCMGAFLLADVGLLDNVQATTHHWGIENLKRSAPKCRVVSGRRFVDSGKIVTTAGVTAGIDGALHLVERFYGKEGAKWTAEEWMEYRYGSLKNPGGEKSSKLSTGRGTTASPAKRSPGSSKQER